MTFPFPCLPVLLLLVATVSSRCIPTMLTPGDANRKDNIDERGPFHGGDMKLNADQLKELKLGRMSTIHRWPGGKIPYIIDPAFPTSELSEVQQGMAEVSNFTCIKFVPRTSETSYINIQRGQAGTGCWAEVGMQPGRESTVNIMGNQESGRGCARHATVAHELVHAIGFYHEQSRLDRDDYVAINFTNIERGRAYNFDKIAAPEVLAYSPYDYGSLMHYSAYAFANDTSIPTMYPKQSGVALSQLGQRNGLSANDVKKINAMYSACIANTVTVWKKFAAM